jgi:spore maturation protein CgeB
MKKLVILYSFSKRGFQAEYWAREIAGASSELCSYIPFNYGAYISEAACARAQLVDNLYYDNDAGLRRLYADLKTAVAQYAADVLLADNNFPYHPDFLATLPVFKVLRTTDGPLAAYDRDFAYLHAYDLVLYHSPAYSRALDMEQKLACCGAKRTAFWPLAAFDAHCLPHLSEEQVFAGARDIDIVFVGAMWTGKVPFFAAVKRAFGSRFVIYGLASWKKMLWLSLSSRRPCWIHRLPDPDYPLLYRRCKIGINTHNRGKYTVGNYRLFDLPANGTLQISDGGEYLPRFYRPGEEIVSYETPGELVQKIRYYLENEQERLRIARNGYRRAMAEHRIGMRLRQAAALIRQAIGHGGEKRASAD